MRDLRSMAIIGVMATDISASTSSNQSNKRWLYQNLASRLVGETIGAVPPTHWQWSDFPKLEREPAQVIADKLLKELAKDDDDATVVIVKS
jgi:hypothetical protein